MREVAGSETRRTLDHMLDEARARIDRYEPQAALAAVSRGAVIVDIRSVDDRRRDGIVPGSLHIPRTVLEWQLDPDSVWRNPHLAGLDQELLLICDHGCSSLLAAATLAGLGFTRVTDIVGGFAAWREARLPTAPNSAARRRAPRPGRAARHATTRSGGCPSPNEPGNRLAIVPRPSVLAEARPLQPGRASVRCNDPSGLDGGAVEG